MTSEDGALVSALEIRGLFGNKYLRVDLGGQAEMHGKGRRLSLLYGSNGSGKTTVLKLLWHALSPSGKGGHRTEISKTPFERFTIFLSDGDVINFIKTNGLVGDFKVVVTRNEKRLVEQSYRETADGKVAAVSPLPESSSQPHQQRPLFEIEPEDGNPEKEYLWRIFQDLQVSMSTTGSQRENRPDRFVAYLDKLGTGGPYMLADDRRIYGDAIERTPPRRVRRHAEFEESVDPQIGGGVTAELTIALRRTHDMIQKMVINGNVSGSRGSNSVYLGILQTISQRNFSEANRVTRQELTDNLKEIANKTSEYSTYGLMPRINEESFMDVLRQTPDSQLAVAEAVLQPFLEAQEARLDALNAVVRLLSTLTEEVNRFFASSGKRAKYRTQSGFKVVSDDSHSLQPENLSSGERQILLLLLNTVLARQSTRLFLIDEPELSLNVKWQRQLMNALLSLTEGASVQFIVATHSIEVITGHRDSLAHVAPATLED